MNCPQDQLLLCNFCNQLNWYLELWPISERSRRAAWSHACRLQCHPICRRCLWPQGDNRCQAIDVWTCVSDFTSVLCHLLQLSSIRQELGRDVTVKLVVTLVFSRLDYCNAVLAGIPATALAPLQRVLDVAARLVNGLVGYENTQYVGHWSVKFFSSQTLSSFIHFMQYNWLAVSL